MGIKKLRLSLVDASGRIAPASVAYFNTVAFRLPCGQSVVLAPRMSVIVAHGVRVRGFVVWHYSIVLTTEATLATPKLITILPIITSNASTIPIGYI